MGNCNSRGLSWEVRKTSPGPRKPSIEKIRSPLKTPRSPRNNANSWAAKVRGDSRDGPNPENDVPVVPRLKLDEIGEDVESDSELLTPKNCTEKPPLESSSFESWECEKNEHDWAEMMNE